MCMMATGTMSNDLKLNIQLEATRRTQMQRTSHLLLLFLSFAFSYSLGDPPKWYESDIIQVYYIPDPFITNSSSITFKDLNSYQTALGFINERTKEMITAQRQPTGTIQRALFPDVVNQTITWYNQAKVVLIEQDFTVYKPIRVFQITGNIMQHYLCWTPMYEEQNPTFELWGIADSYMNSSNHKMWLNPSNADDFIWESMRVLYNLGGTVDEVQGLQNNRTMFHLYSPWGHTKIPFKGNEQAISEFFAKQPMSTQSVLDFYSQHIAKQMYVYYGGEYYSVTTMAEATIEYMSVPFADQGAIDASTVPLKPGCIVTNETRKISAGSILLIMIAIGIALYIVIGVIYNSVKGKRGAHRFPNYTFWKHFPGLVRDGFRFVILKVTGRNVGESSDPILAGRNDKYDAL
eukprot:TRINITY_DN1651_c0_g1_i1.p1 TRINITY_DN1651_c0_g1~~TRINITY_DN1651_c0_g1_i1.p1  ORF type:complete len:405 (-),score=105.07 TRINITY_DN1651_c0_g1_i1:72-1286(-)